MATYEKMYAILCGAASDAVDCLQSDERETAIKVLITALRKTEDLFIDT